MVLEPEDVGQQEEDPEGNMQANNNVENGAENNGQWPNNDDLDIPPDADLLSNNVDHWVRRCREVEVSRYRNNHKNLYK